MRTRITHSRFTTLAALLVVTFISAALPASTAADTPRVHVVGWGDTLSTIAARYGTTVTALKQANNLRSADFIWTGQRLLIPGAATVPVPSKFTTYVVQPGDTLFSIASRYDTTVADVMQANSLYSYWIYVGQTLRIPGQPAPVVVPPPPSQGVYYIVRRGDYLSMIAARYGTTTYAIQIANRLSNASFIWPGQRLFIPGAAPIVNPPMVILPPVAPIFPTIVLQVPPTATPPLPPVAPMTGATQAPPTATPGSTGTVWQAVLLANTTTPPCYLSVNVVGKSDWPVVVATTDGSYISEPKLTGSKPDKGPYIVEFAHSCTGTWRVIPLGLNTYADVALRGGHADLEFRLR